MAIRRSGRTIIPTKRYTANALESIEVASSSDVEDEEDEEEAQMDARDEEFAVNPTEDEEDEVDQEDQEDHEEEFKHTPPKSPVYPSREPLQPLPEEPAGDRDDVPKGQSKRNVAKDQGIHSRGNRAPEKSAKQESIRCLFGLDPADLLPFVLSRDRWLHDPIYPTRHEELQAGGLGLFPGFTPAMRAQEAHSGWDWYYRDQGQRKFTLGQQKQILTAEGPSYLPDGQDAQFLLGPYGKQSLHELAPFQVFESRQAWISTDQDASQSRGWIINAGAKILCLDWAPNQEGDTQYLAIGTASKLQHSALEPSLPYKSSIQIWSFSRRSELPRPEPRLVEVICTQFGSIRELKWCPMQRQHRGTESKIVPLGLMASIWSDGHVRVLDINHERAEVTSFTSYKSIFTACPPSTMATALTWLSPTILAVGLANGFLAVYNLLHGIQHFGPPLPYIYTSIHQSYVYKLTSAYPLHPQFLVSTSVDGYLRLTDVRNPDTDFVLSQRARLGPVALVYSPALQSAVAPGDSDKTIRLLPLRRFYSATSIARVTAQVLSLAMGTTHTSLLIGSADGTVLATNPMKRLVMPKRPPLQLAWFKYEWMARAQTKGISRFTEGYKVEVARTKDVPRGKAVQGGFETIYEEETGITALAWNPNVHAGAWAAAGTGSGLVRVEDLAV